MDKESAKVFVSKLRDRIKTQLRYEYDTEERVSEELENMTVARFLEMLEYMFEGD